MLIQLYSRRNNGPGLALLLAKSLFLFSVIFLTIYFFARGHRIYGFLTMVGSFLIVLLFNSAWPEPVPLVLLNDEGIFDRRSGFGMILWEDMLDAQLEVKGPFICLRVKDPEVYIGRLPPKKRDSLQFQQNIGFKMLNIDLTGVAGNPLDILELIRTKIQSPH